MDEVERAGRRAAERRGAAAVRLLGVGWLLRFVTVRQLAERREGREGRGGQDGGGHRGQAAQAVRHRVGVELDLGVVEVLLPVAAVRVAVPPTGGGRAG